MTQPIDAAEAGAISALMLEHERRCPTVANPDPQDPTSVVRCTRDRGHFGATHIDRYGWRWRA